MWFDAPAFDGAGAGAEFSSSPPQAVSTTSDKAEVASSFLFARCRLITGARLAGVRHERSRLHAVADKDKIEKVVGPLEAEILNAVWGSDGTVTVREVAERINAKRSKPLAYTTVMTVMSRLAAKGVLRRQRKGRGYLYEAVADSAAGIAVQEVMRDFGDAALAQFVEEARADPSVLRRIQKLLEEKS